MDKEYYTSSEYKKIDEYKHLKAEDYRARREYFGNKLELKSVPEENHDTLRAKLKEAPKASKQDDSGLKKLLDKITATSTTVATSTAVIVAGAGAVAVAPEIIPDLPPIIPDALPVVDLSLGVIELSDGLEYVYSGEEIKPSFTLLVGGNEIDSKYYNIEYINNISPGIGTIKITSNDKGYSGELSLDFIILKKERALTIKNVNGSIIVDGNLDTEFKYYSDSECKNEIEKPSKPGLYYIRAYMKEDSFYYEGYSNILEYNLAKVNKPIEIKYVGNEIEASDPNALIKYYSDSECKNEIERPAEYGHYYVRAYTPEDDYYLDSYSNILDYIVPLDLSKASIELINNEAYIYNGSELKPLIRIIYKGLEIDPSLYKIEYINNILPGEGSIVAKANNDNVIGEVKMAFNILKASNTITISYNNDEVLIDSRHGTPILKYYSDKECSIEVEKPLGYGHYFIRALVVEDDLYKASISNVLAYDILLDLSKCTISILGDSEYFYTGGALMPTVELTLNGEAIDPSLYNVSYLNNKMPGTAEIIASGVANESMGEVKASFRIAKRINSISLSGGGDNVVATATYGTPVIKYYSDIGCTNLIDKPIEIGSYYLRAEVAEGDTYEASVSDVMEYNVFVKENEAWVGNSKLELDLSVAEGSSYKVWIKEIPTSTRSLSGGNEKVLFEGLENSKAYTIAVYSGEINKESYKEHYSKTLTTKDGSEAILRYSFKPAKSAYSESTNLDYDILVDGIDIYSEYRLELEDMDGYVAYIDLKNGSNSGTIEALMAGMINVSASAIKKLDSSVAMLEGFTYMLRSLFPAPDKFIRGYRRPTDSSSIAYTIEADGITVGIDLGLSDYDEYSYFEVRIIDQDNNSYYGEIYSNDDKIYNIPLDISSFRAEVAEVIAHDGIKRVYDRYMIPGKVVLKEGISKKAIIANKESGKLFIDLDINMKPDSKAILRNVTENTTYLIEANMEVPLPSALTEYEYYLEDSGGLRLTTPVGFIVDPTKYNVAKPDTFIPVEPRDTIKSYNSDNTWNMYLYTGFEAQSPNLSYMVRVFNDSYNEYYISKLPYLEVANLKDEYSLEYFIGSLDNDVYYVSDVIKTSLDTTSNTSNLNSFVTLSYNKELDETTISLKLKDIDTIYDLNNVKLKYGLYDMPTVVSLNEASFSYDSKLRAYTSDIVFSGSTSWWELSLMANNNIKNLDKLEALATIKGSKYTSIVVRSY